MKRIPGEPTFIFTTATTVQVWTLADYLRYHAVDHTWSLWMLGIGRWVHPSILLSDEAAERIFTCSTEELSHTCHVEGMPYRKQRLTLQPMIHRYETMGSNPAVPQPLIIDTWVPDLDKDIPDITPWEWTEEGLEITLRLPGEEPITSHQLINAVIEPFDLVTGVSLEPYDLLPWYRTEDGQVVTRDNVFSHHDEERPIPMFPRPGQPLVPVAETPGCVQHSWGIAHVKPSCRCRKPRR